MPKPHVQAFRIQADVPVPKPAYLWEPYLPRGSLAVLDGDPGVGKSFVAIDLLARLSAGLPMPDGQPARVKPSQVLIASAEDSVEDTLVPRFVAAGGDLKNLLFFGGLSRDPELAGPALFPRDRDAFASILKEVRPKLIVLDPMMALVGASASANNDQSIREVLTFFADLASLTCATFLLIRHLNKYGGGKSLYRGSGSIGIAGAVRSGLLAGVHPDDPERRVLSVTKSNLGAPGPSLTYRLAERGGKFGVIWDGPTNLTADDLCQMSEEPAGRSERAEAWLEKLLRAGPVPASRVEAEATAAGVSFATLRLAKKRLPVVSRRVVREGKQAWEWAWREEGLTELPELGPIT